MMTNDLFGREVEGSSKQMNVSSHTGLMTSILLHLVMKYQKLYYEFEIIKKHTPKMIMHSVTLQFESQSHKSSRYEMVKTFACSYFFLSLLRISY